MPLARSFEIHTISAMEMRAGGLKLKAIEAIWSTVAVMFCFSHLASGEILRLSKVVAEGSVNAERIELNHGNTVILFVGMNCM